MSVRRRQNWLGQQRVDVPHLKSIESAVSNDFDELISGLVTGENKSFIVRGFEINMPGAILSAANGLQLIVENSAILHGASNESGTFYTIPSGVLPEILNRTVNERVEGAFTPSANNYIGIEFVRKVDDSTVDQVNFFNPTSNIEFPRTVPLAILLDYKIVITTSSFALNVLPIAVVLTNSSNNVVSITDRRPLLFRLGIAGESSPDPFYNYPWSDGREESYYTSFTSSSNPFKGGDKQLHSMKDFFDALMTELKQIKGMPYWYSESAGGSLLRLRQDTTNTIFTGAGIISHDLNIPGKINWTNNLFFNFVGGDLRYKILSNPSTSDTVLSNNQIAYVKLVRGEDVLPSLVFINGGDLVESIGGVAWTQNLVVGDFIKEASKGDEFYYEISEILNTTTVRIAKTFTEQSSPETGVRAQYALGVYQTNSDSNPLTNLNDRNIKIIDRSKVPFGEDYFWLLFRQDDEGSVVKVYTRALGGKELEQGEDKQISDNTSLNVLSFIGSKSEADTLPDYTNIIGSAKTNLFLSDGDNLVKSIKKLELRNDIIPRARLIDLTSISLPTGVLASIDGVSLINGDLVFFTNPSIEGLYRVSGIGLSVQFQKLDAFTGEKTPVNGDLIRVESGTLYFRTIWKRVNGYWKPIEVDDAVKEPSGFPNRTDSEISFNDSARTFSISPLSPATHFDIFAKGRIFRFYSSQQILIPDVEGIFFFYFETDGTLAYSNVFNISIITEKIYVSTIYWDSTNKKAILISDERHGITLDGATHEYLHNVNGAVVTSGGAINFTSPAGLGDLNSDAQITLGNIVFRDEDIRMDITNSISPSSPFEQILDPVAQIPIFYRDGFSGNWRKSNATQFPVKQGVSRIQYNNPEGPWTQEDIQEGYFVSMWVFATNNISEPVIAILGQKEHSLLSDAQEQDTYDSLSFGTMPTQEFKVLYRTIFQSSSAYTNAAKAVLVDVRDLRAAEDTQFAQVAPNDHGLLSGLNDPDHGPTAVTTLGVAKNGGLSETDVDLKQSLDTINKILGQLVIVEHPVNKKRIKITGAERVLNSNKNISVTLENLLLEFDGAEIDFLTGDVYKSDGITNLGINFAPAVMPIDNYIYYSITMVLSTVSSLNKIEPQIVITPASSSNSVRSLAPRAIFGDGIHIGQVVVRKNGVSIYDISNQDIVQVLYQGVKKLPFQGKGDILVFNGDDIVRLPPGNPDEVLTVDVTAPEGIAWKVNPGLGGLGLDEDGNFNLELVPETLLQWVLKAPDDTRYEVTINNEGILSTEITTKPVSPVFNFKNNFNEDCQILVDNTGTLSIISPPLEIGIIEPLNLVSPSGYNWKITIIKNSLNINEIITDTYNNQFLVKTENQNHFAVKQSDEAHALVYVQVYNSESLPSTPQNIPGLLPFCFYNDGVSSNLMYFNGSSWVFSTPPGTVQAYVGAVAPEGWAICDGESYGREAYSSLFAVIGTTYGSDAPNTFKVPNYQGIFLRGAGSQTVTEGTTTVTYNATLGQKQVDRLQNITGGFVVNRAIVSTFVGAFQGTDTGQERCDGTAGTNAGNVTFNASRVARTSTETRPANAGVNYIIKL
jgi:microcystin-dependent protein